LAELIGLIQKGTITGKAAKDVFADVFETQKAPSEIVKAKGLTAVSDTGAIEKWCDEAIAENPKAVAEYKGGKTTAIGSLVGVVMKKSEKRANPQIVNQILQKKLGS
jgi:aspartyl-tRNA(Asn)/glutamyl-tRNA(Gln) amidotransferase subunit B